MVRASIAAGLLAVLATPVPAADYPMLDQLEAEAETLQAKHPDRWKHYRDQAERVFAENARVAAAWRRRSAPPRPHLEPLQLPLAFLTQAVQRAEPPIGRVKGNDGRHGGDWRRRHDAYLAAIVHHPDVRRIEVLLEYRDKLHRQRPDLERFDSWGKRIAEAATREWAVGRIARLARQDRKLDINRLADDLLYCLIDRFAGELPGDVRKLAFDYLWPQDPQGPIGTAEERIWDVLFRLDPPRARKEIIRSFGTPTGAALRYNYYVPALLFQHPGPSPELARAVHRWLSTEDTLTAYDKQHLRVVLLRADPEHELEPTIKFIDQSIAEQKRKKEPFEFLGNVHLLVLALGDLDVKEADRHLARYVFEPAIDEGVRFLVLESLAKHQYPKMPELAARWLSEASPHMQLHLRREAEEKWGAYGRAVLEQAGRINQRKAQTRGTALPDPS